MVGAGSALLEKNREAVNQLNVFPVPDGDTGTNMSMTMMSAYRELNSRENISIGDAVGAVAKGALRGARGNSGVILSQLYRGFSKALEGLEEPLSPRQFAAAMKSGADTAYKAVMKPKEGTILTVARVIADEAVLQAEREPEDFDALFRTILSQGEIILAKTQEMLPQLKAAGVIDAGGRGLLIVYAGYYAAFKGEQIEDTVIEMSGDAAQEDVFADDHENLDEIKFAYCTEFFVQNPYNNLTDTDIATFRRKLSRIGDCVLAVGDNSMLKVHVHTNDPGKALQYGLMLGELAGMKIDNMLQQRRDNEAKKAEENAKAEPKDFGMVSVSLGNGFSSIFKDLGVDAVVEGGQTMNPSIEDLSRAVEAINAETIFILPNNGNVILAAQQVAELSEKNIVVLPTKNVAMGLAAVVAFQPDFSAEDNTARMNEAAERVRTGTITYAVRDTHMEQLDIKEGSIIGLRNGEVTVNGLSIEETALELMRQIVTDDDVLITVYYGGETENGEAEALGAKLAEIYPMCDVEVQNGGQPLYYYLLSVE
jgi:DAK2 domain fusion protein YloV